MIEIRNWIDDRVLFSGEYTTIKEAVEAAVRSGARLDGARLTEAWLTEARLTGAWLTGARLDGARLTGARLTGARLDGARLTGAWLTEARLDGARLTGTQIAFQSHDLLAELLKRAAGNDVEKLKIAGYILVCREKCWKEFAELAKHDPLGDWALDELAKWVQDGDDAPDVLRMRATGLKKVSQT